MKHSRRNFLSQAGTAAGIFATQGAFAQNNPLAFGSGHFPAKAKSIIWLHMTGAPSQMDTFDYKPVLNKNHGKPLPDADSKTGFFTTSGKCLASPFAFKQYGESGAWVSDLFPHLSNHVDDMAFIYSMYSRSNNHTPAMLELTSGFFRQGFPSIASWLMYGLGTPNKSLPGSFVLHAPKKPRGEDPIWSTGFLPKIFQATAIDGGNKKVIDNLDRLDDLTDDQQRSQLDAIKFLNDSHRTERLHTSNLEARQEAYELAYRMQTSAPNAFNLNNETESTRKLYGIGTKDTELVGRQLLTARRLVERGVRFIHVFAGTNGGGGGVNDVPWDGHNDIKANHTVAARSVDKPISALLADLKQRGMLDETLVVWGGEFGRTSDSQGNGTGRDHNPNAFTMWFAGGGIKGGARYGRTDEFGYKAIENRTSVHDLHATVLHLMGLDHEKLTYRHNGRDFRLTDVAGNLIHDILG
ncbi:MAG: DUF1501 domain-containing protein [Opitutae bacterium]|nr:DUF1501 domain-containing protein [Opitutae bacterium]